MNGPPRMGPDGARLGSLVRSRAPGRLPATLGALLLALVAACGGGTAPTGAARGDTAPPPAAAANVAPPPAAAPAAPALLPMRVAYPAISALQLPFYLAEDAGLFQRYGLDVELVYIQAAPNVARSLMAGDVAIAGLGPRVLLEAAGQGADLVLIANQVPTYSFSLYGDPRAGVQRMEDLRGKTLAVTQRGAATDLAGRHGLRHAGLTPEVDVEIAHVKDVPAVLTTVLQGLAAGGVVSPPSTLKGREGGLVELLNLRTLGLPYLDVGIGARREYLAANREAALRWMRAYSAAIALLKDDPAAAERALARYTATDEPGLLAESYAAAREIFAFTEPYVPLDALQAVLDEVENPTLRAMPPDAFVDQSLVAELDAEGFYAQLR
jgi:NitT/TauT family transport system substrate-binding protein